MLITDSESIKNYERDLIDGITGDLDWAAIEKLFREKHRLSIEDDIEFKQGDIVVHQNDVAYKLDFEVKLTLSILFDRKGESLGISTSGDIKTSDDNSMAENDATIESVSEDAEKDVSDPVLSSIGSDDEERKMASKIADMITDINEA